MNKSSTKCLHVFAIGFTLYILLLFFSVCLRTLTIQILIKNMGITNSFTETILFDVEYLDEASENEEVAVEIDWQKLYPFHNSETTYNEKNNSKISQIGEFIDLIEKKITVYTTEFLPFYTTATELAGNYEQLILWNFSSLGEYNNVTVRDGGYLVGIEDMMDTSVSSGAAIQLANFCESEGVQFVYIEYPNKICTYEDYDISGTMDFSNQNVNAFLNELNNNGVLTYDLRMILHEEGLNHHSLFFKTDHHWKPQTGLWASQRILDFLNRNFDRSYNIDNLDSDNYYDKIYENWFLGSQGKKVTLSVCSPEDISLIYPKFETLIHYEVPSLTIDECGSFNITYDMECIESKDYYNKNPYAAYDHADQALVKIENQLLDDDSHVLIIHNSFSNCVIPFLAMEIRNIDAIDLRKFTGSLQSYILQEKPDIVIVAYQSIPGSIDYSTHTDTFDFR